MLRSRAWRLPTNSFTLSSLCIVAASFPVHIALSVPREGLSRAYIAESVPQPGLIYCDERLVDASGRRHCRRPCMCPRWHAVSIELYAGASAAATNMPSVGYSPPHHLPLKSGAGRDMACATGAASRCIRSCRHSHDTCGSRAAALRQTLRTLCRSCKWTADVLPYQPSCVETCRWRSCVLQSQFPPP